MDMQKRGQAGNNGKNMKSDCFVTYEQGNQDISIEIRSKVKALYGKSIRHLAEDMMRFFAIDKGRLVIEDGGALEFVLAARIEAAVKQVVPLEKNYLFPQLEENRRESAKDRFRFSRLYLPGNSPKLMLNAGIHRPDGLILDLEDAVAPPKKPEARFLVRNALRSLRFYGAERMVRINQGQLGLEDLEYVVPHFPNLILVPKVETPQQILEVNKKIESIQASLGMQHAIWLMPIIESALGVIKAYDIASAAGNIVAMAIGLEDYTADIGTRRTNEATESFFARSMVVNAAKAAGIQAIDSVFSDVSDMEALKQNVLKSKALGFDGMGCIHPRQIPVIHENFAPLPEEIEKAQKIVLAFEDAKAKGLGVVSLDTKMIDPPVVKRAERIVNLAVSLGKLDENRLKSE